MTADPTARPNVTIHPTADVDPRATIGAKTRIWHQAQVREGATLGEECIIGKSAYIDHDVRIGNRVKIQNHASVYHGVTIGDGVFVGPHVVFTNDRNPRAITPEGVLQSDSDWEVALTTVRYGASVGAGSIVLPGLVIGRYALVGACSVVTRDVPDHALVLGNPARRVGYVCVCGQKLAEHGARWACPACERAYVQDESGLVPS